MEQMRTCYVASRVFCPMLSIERDGDSCLRCIHFAGVLTEGNRLAVSCRWSPRDRESVDEPLRLAA